MGYRCAVLQLLEAAGWSTCSNRMRRREEGEGGGGGRRKREEGGGEEREEGGGRSGRRVLAHHLPSSHSVAAQAFSTAPAFACIPRVELWHRVVTIPHRPVHGFTAAEYHRPDGDAVSSVRAPNRHTNCTGVRAARVGSSVSMICMPDLGAGHSAGGKAAARRREHRIARSVPRTSLTQVMTCDSVRRHLAHHAYRPYRDTRPTSLRPRSAASGVRHVSSDRREGSPHGLHFAGGAPGARSRDRRTVTSPSSTRPGLPANHLHRHRAEAQVIAIRRRVQRAKPPIGVGTGRSRASRRTTRQHDLEGIARSDVLLAPGDVAEIIAVGVSRRTAGHDSGLARDEWRK